MGRENYSKPKIKIPYWEITTSASCSSGPGGQNVNKTATKVTLRFNVDDSKTLTETQKKTIKEELKNRINDEGEIVISEQSARSQHTNRKVVTKRFYDLINKALIPEKERRETKPTEGSKNRRINEKKQRSKIKKHRGKVEME